ncbi:MAG: beta-galactosidase, partial [Anaerolineae bacterium]|nr:beta-galactosidase [Anaerolineae bacterium]
GALLAGCAPAPTPTPTPVPTSTPVPTYEGPLDPVPVTGPRFDSLTYGIQAFLWWSPDARSFDLEMIRLMNFSHVKQIFAWGDIEPEPGVFNWSYADEVVAEVLHRERQLVARLDHPPEWAIVDPASRPDGVPFDVEGYADFCGRLAGRYQGQIAGYQVWNEPNLQREWAGHVPDAAGYVTLLRACSAAIREADPEAIVISAGLAPTETEPPLSVPDERYLQAMFDAGLSETYDVLGVHAPGYNNPPEMSPDEAEAAGLRRWMVFRHVEDIRRIQIANGDGHKQIALLEFGWHINPGIHEDYAWFAVDEQTQAEYLVGAYRYAAEHWRPWMGLMSTIYISAPGWTEQNEEYWWAVTTPGLGGDYGVRQAYIDLANMEKIMGETVIPARAPDEANHEPLGARD